MDDRKVQTETVCSVFVGWRGVLNSIMEVRDYTNDQYTRPKATYFIEGAKPRVRCYLW